jgi:hypothetical protein
MSIYATTFGTGPFDPCISYHGRLYRLNADRQFSRQEDAFDHAQALVSSIRRQSLKALEEAGYKEVKL